MNKTVAIADDKKNLYTGLGNQKAKKKRSKTRVIFKLLMVFKRYWAWSIHRLFYFNVYPVEVLLWSVS